MQKPSVIIMAGGSNSRFFPFNSTQHKGTITLHGQTLLSRTLANLKAHDFNEICIVISPRDQENGFSDELIASTKKELNLSLKFAIQTEAKGMGNAVLTGATVFPNATQLAIISPYQITAGELLDQMLAKGETCLCTTTTNNPANYGIVHFSDAGLVDQIIEKPTVGTEPSNQKVLTLYLVNQRFMEILAAEPAAEYNFETALDKSLHEQPAPTLKLEEPLPSLKYPWDLFAFQKLFDQQLKSQVDESAHIATTAVIDESAGKVWIESGVKIGHASRIVGPAYIGKNVTVGDFCLIRESSLEANVLVGAHSEIARSIMMPASTIHRGYIGNSIIGAGTKLGAGLVTANKRFDRQLISVEVKGKLVSSGQKALGVMIGDQVRVGTNVTTMPGICIGSQSTILPGLVISRNVTPNTIKKD